MTAPALHLHRLETHQHLIAIAVGSGLFLMTGIAIQGSMRALQLKT